MITAQEARALREDGYKLTRDSIARAIESSSTHRSSTIVKVEYNHIDRLVKELVSKGYVVTVYDWVDGTMEIDWSKEL